MTSSERRRSSCELRIGGETYSRRQIANVDDRPDDGRREFDIDGKVRGGRRRHGAAKVAVLARLAENGGRIVRVRIAAGIRSAMADDLKGIGRRSATGHAGDESGEQDMQRHGVNRHKRHPMLQPPDHRNQPPVLCLLRQ